MGKKVLLEKQGHIAYVTINRPEVHNCIDVETSDELIHVSKLVEKATEMAEMIAGNGPLAIRAAKQAVLNSIGRPLEEGIMLNRYLQLPLRLRGLDCWAKCLSHEDKAGV